MCDVPLSQEGEDLKMIALTMVKVKVQCTLVQALRLCTSLMAHRGSRGIGKGTVHRCTGTEGLYRPYGP